MDIRDIRKIGAAKPKKSSGKKEYEPTPEQIASECLEIHKTWTEAERLRRSTPERPVDMQTVYRVVEDSE